MKSDIAGTGTARRGGVLTRRITISCALVLMATAVSSGRVAGADAHPGAPPPPAAPRSTSEAPGTAAAVPVTGSRNALVITVELAASANGTPHTVPDLSPNQVRSNVIFGSQPWFRAASNGKFAGFIGLSRGPVTVRTTAEVCEPEWLVEIGDQADATIRQREPALNFNQFAAVVYYFGKVAACARSEIDGNAGWAAGKRIWLNGDSSLRVAVHELGHNLGLSHSGSQTCVDANGVTVPLSTNCRSFEYGDVFSAMGSTFNDGYSPFQRAQLGWDDGRSVTLGASATTTHISLTAPETNPQGAIQTLRLIDGSALWIEYRMPATQTTTPGRIYTSGLLIRREPSAFNQPPGSPYLLFMNPPESIVLGTVEHPNLFVGQTWKNPVGQMQITLDSADATTAQLTIQLAR